MKKSDEPSPDDAKLLETKQDALKDIAQKALDDIDPEKSHNLFDTPQAEEVRKFLNDIINEGERTSFHPFFVSWLILHPFVLQTPPPSPLRRPSRKAGFWLMRSKTQKKSSQTFSGDWGMLPMTRKRTPVPLKISCRLLLSSCFFFLLLFFIIIIIIITFFLYPGLFAKNNFPPFPLQLH